MIVFIFFLFICIYVYVYYFSLVFGSIYGIALSATQPCTVLCILQNKCVVNNNNIPPPKHSATPNKKDEDTTKIIYYNRALLLLLFLIIYYHISGSELCILVQYSNDGCLIHCFFGSFWPCPIYIVSLYIIRPTRWYYQVVQGGGTCILLHTMIYYIEYRYIMWLGVLLVVAGIVLIVVQ